MRREEMLHSRSGVTSDMANRAILSYLQDALRIADVQNVVSATAYIEIRDFVKKFKENHVEDNSDEEMDL